MKIVLHIGNSKAASSSIQENLFEHRNILLKSRFLVPSFGGRMVRPRLLADMFLGIEDLTKNEYLRQSITLQINAHLPEVLFLSSEHLLSGVSHLDHMTKKVVESIQNQLAIWSTDIHIHALIRDPVSLYRSHSQQMLKATDVFDSPVTWRASHIPGIPVWASVFGPKFQPLPFQKSTFLDGNAVKDLICRYCPVLSTPINTLDFTDSNSSEFAEVTVILQKYFAVNYPGQPRAFRDDANFLLSTLARIAKTLAIGTPPRLHDEVAQVILSNHADQIRILRDEYGLIFEHLDAYEKYAENVVADFSFTGQFGDICRFDAKVVDTLFCAALKQLTLRDAD